MKAIGLDIGTTTICAIVLEVSSGEVLKAVTLTNDTFESDCKAYEKIQNPHKIAEKSVSLVKALIEEYEDIKCIGVTGQMHGIVYLDKEGKACSNLYIWQDESGNEIFKDEQTYAEYLSSLTGYKMASGFGGSTYFVHQMKKEVPEDAVTFCTIHDYVAMILAGLSKPVMHTSDAASYGLFDIPNACFDKIAIEKAGLCYDMFPSVSKENKILGEFSGKIPVSVAIGDNQASFIGSVCDIEDCLLVNVGTGSQISFMTKSFVPAQGLEIRPCIEDKMLMVGSSLCGGRAFALLEEFFRKTAEMVTGQKCETAYHGMDRCLQEIDEVSNPIVFTTLFSGTREQPEKRASITELGTHNFTPEHFLYGTLEGMANELIKMYQQGIEVVPERPRQLIGSGNGLRKNKALQKIFEKMFSMQLKIPVHREEAAFGCALFALTSCGIFDSIQDAQKMIKYK